MKVLVIGGGPAGMLAAITAKNDGNQVILIEKMDTLGKKLAITGKGRCNITSSIEITDFIKNIPGNGRFLYSAFQKFNNNDIINLLGISTKVERGNRVFPTSDNAKDVVYALEKNLKGVEIHTNTEVEKIITEKYEVIDENGNKVNKIKATGVKTDRGNFEADKIILATGGKSYPTTGSTGDGYKMATEVGHTITEIKPSLVALTASEKSIKTCQELQGLSLKNVAIKVFNKNKKIYEDFGEMLFTHFGISGPIILSSSAHLVREEFKDTYVEIDLKPALSEEKLDERILRDFSEEKNKYFKNSLNELLPQKMIPVVIEQMGIDKKVNEITKEERQKLINILKHFKIYVNGFRGIEEAIVTAGGINIKEINPKTMESKIIKNLYFAGEIIDVDAYTGGFNLQIAYSTGYTAGKNE
jgi:predicted Rossmann fold flavoprotein